MESNSSCVAFPLNSIVLHVLLKKQPSLLVLFAHVFVFSAFTCIFSTPTAFSVFNDTLAAPRGPFEAGFGLGTSALQLASGQGHSAVLRRLVAVLTARCLLNFARKRDTTSFWVPVFWDRNSEGLGHPAWPKLSVFPEREPKSERADASDLVASAAVGACSLQ